MNSPVKIKDSKLLVDTNTLAYYTFISNKVLGDKMKVQYYTKGVYGKDLMYLVDCEVARIINSLNGQKTISES